ncbi:MAG: phage holin family protein [Chloroflexi bacterium]|nr:phage holin family protein [Chloroflexota bacterium]
MSAFIRRWLVTLLAIVIAALLLPAYVRYAGTAELLVFAALLALLNAIVRPVLLLLTCPINLLTLGLFVLVINGFVFWLATLIFPGVQVADFWAAILAALVVSVVSFIVNRLFP